MKFYQEISTCVFKGVTKADILYYLSGKSIFVKKIDGYRYVMQKFLI
jgi:hypothetical protein